MERKISKQVRGFRTQDGAGVSLVRVLGNGTVQEYDPILMLDSFDSTNPDDYTAGFPMHPHRGIETISYVYRGFMTHKDSLGNEDTIGDGEVQWMTAGSGIMHEEKLPAAERMLGVQLWLNLPSYLRYVTLLAKIKNETAGGLLSSLASGVIPLPHQLHVLNGSMNIEERSDALRDFRDRASIFVSTDAGGEGLNLQFSNIIVNYY